ncbi:hypothetical protein EVAR_30808_1 [Eumeta japonica]|uniref:Uncharacterized protein n=1 Tax=Eumeta variegata TaxID=151549 RepID=A0A4C1V8B1_EUMVA|nr:hypothetical protein EVAR_30808_1 [Eumeta japonica]
MSTPDAEALLNEKSKLPYNTALLLLFGVVRTEFRSRLEANSGRIGDKSSNKIRMMSDSVVIDKEDELINWMSTTAELQAKADI